MTEGITLTRESRWSDREATLLLVPLVATAVAILPFLGPEIYAAVVGYPGDGYVYRLGAAAALGYTVATFAGLRDGRRAALRHVLVAGLTYSALVILAVLVEPLRGRQLQPVALALGATAVVTLAINAALMRTAAFGAGPSAAGWVIALLWTATGAALFFGVAPMVPAPFTDIFGYADTSAFTFRMAGAATAGYAAMGLAELRSPRWSEIRLPLLMGLTFNGLAFVASAIELAAGGGGLLAALVAVASLAFTAGFALALRSAKA